MIKLEFGNLEHLAIVQAGIMCSCSHSKADHSNGIGYCLKDEVVDCECDDCGDEHQKTVECSCKNFKLNENLKFNTHTNTFMSAR